MMIIRFMGGLGNQMFQYASYKRLQKQNPGIKADISWYADHHVHNGFELNRIFGIRLKFASPFIVKLYDTDYRAWIFRKLRRLLGLKNASRIESNLFAHDPQMFLAPARLFTGYWQNERYFSEIADELQRDFTFKPPLSDQNRSTLEQIKSSNSVSIHIRRGDYVSDPMLGGLCGISYYQEAVNLIASKIPNPSFFVFSDDPDWCRANLPLTGGTFVSWNNAENSYADMLLMSNCKHNIIANSSFSWWAAWLNSAPGKIVIGPKKWINDQNIDTSTFFPAGWIRL